MDPIEKGDSKQTGRAQINSKGSLPGHQSNPRRISPFDFCKELLPDTKILARPQIIKVSFERVRWKLFS